MHLVFLMISLILSSCSLSLKISEGPNQREITSKKVSSVLYIGDSQTAGTLGSLMYDQLKIEYPNAEINLFGIGSSSPRHWNSSQSRRNGRWLCKRRGRFNDQRGILLKDKICSKERKVTAITHLIQKYQPDLVIMQFLGNSAGIKKNDQIHKNVTGLLSKLGSRQERECLFITSPPHYKGRIKSNKRRMAVQNIFINAIGKRCSIIKGMNSRLLNTLAEDSSYYAKDKIHLQKSGATLFFNYVKERM